MSSFSFILTEDCNWDCEYCYFTDLEKRRSPKLEVFQNHLPYIKKIMDKVERAISPDINWTGHGQVWEENKRKGSRLCIDIQGGEVGTMPIDILQYFFETLDFHKVAVSTNGEFLKKGYHLDEKIRPYVGYIMWHVTDDINSTVEVDYNDDEIFISKGIVHNDVDEIVEFLKRNSHITFDYVEFEFDIKEKKTMDILMYHSLLNKIEGIQNVTDNAREILYRRLSEKENLRENCKRYNASICIDLVNEKICLCQRQLNDCMPLNRYSLIKRLRGFPKDFFEGKNCDTCTRLYAGKYLGNVIERSLRVRSAL